MSAARDDAHDVTIHRENEPVLDIDACARQCVKIALEELCLPDTSATRSGYVFEERVDLFEGLLVLTLPVLIVNPSLIIP